MRSAWLLAGVLLAACGGSVAPGDPSAAVVEGAPAPAASASPSSSEVAPPVEAPVVDVSAEERGCGWTAEDGPIHRMQEWRSGGRLVRRQLDDATDLFTWDAAGRLTSRRRVVPGYAAAEFLETFMWSGRQYAFWDAMHGVTLQFEVDADDRLVRYDEKWTDISGRGSIAYDDAGRLSSIVAIGGAYCGGPALLVQRWSYDATGAPRSFDYGEIYNARSATPVRVGGCQQVFTNEVTASHWHVGVVSTVDHYADETTDSCDYDFGADGMLVSVRCGVPGTDSLVRRYVHDPIAKTTTMLTAGEREHVKRFVVDDACNLVPTRENFAKVLAPIDWFDRRTVALLLRGGSTPEVPQPNARCFPEGC